MFIRSSVGPNKAKNQKKGESRTWVSLSVFINKRWDGSPRPHAIFFCLTLAHTEPILDTPHSRKPACPRSSVRKEHRIPNVVAAQFEEFLQSLLQGADTDHMGL